MPETLPAGGPQAGCAGRRRDGSDGDPSFKAAERKLNTEETVQEWVDKIRKQVAPFLDFDCGENSAIAANNYDWFGNMNVLTFLRDIGKHFSVNQ
ncbi:tyrosyl-tRNA synthetase [Escherichia coli]|uniref:Tyrosyl-tRNA synthetase n=1 Tax=Escherichia coli TaxID=562 RepID=A0A376S873_ECOLX|nr:tyrosyl-tRNA synthetase [Escherichia coli]